MDLELTACLFRGEPVSYAEAVEGSYTPLRVGDAWGPPWSTTWIHVRGVVPDEWHGRSVVAVFDLGFEAETGFTCEALAWRDGRPWRGVDPNHPALPITGPDFDFYLEAAANPRAAESGDEPAQSMIALRSSPNPIFILRRAELIVAPESAPPRRPDLGGHAITAVGHAHIDTAWEWPLREGRRKCARSWSTQLELMDAHHDYVFACSQPAQYAWIKESYPDLFRRIREKVASRQWEPVGAMWVEADCNLPSGESLVRQMLYGKRFYQRELGVETKIAWLPDVFGFPGNLPQLIKEAGCEFFLTQKLSWNDTNPPEHHTFWWEGIDGTRVLAHFPPADTYNGDFSPEQLEYSVRNFKDAERSNRSLYLFGFGDGGGGATEEMIQAAHHFGVELGRASTFFEHLATAAAGLATVHGELYFELHRGTYTSQARTKRLNRIAQEAIREAELWSVAAGGPYPSSELEALWKSLLLNQFHDILPGSSIDWVYQEAERDLSHVAFAAARITARAIKHVIGDGYRVAVFNANSHRRREVIDFGHQLRLVEAPACGWAVQEELSVRDDQRVRVSERGMENGLLRVRWDDRGLLSSIFDKQAQREVLSGPANVLQLHDDNPRRWDAWDLDAESLSSPTDVTGPVRLEFEEAGGLRGAVRFTREFGLSTVTQRMVLDAGSRVLRFECDVDWQETHKLLKVAFPVAVSASEAVYEIQFGHVRRPTHVDDPRAKAMFEVCAQRWADLGDGSYGVALINDCKHGYDIHGSTMRLSLLRAPTHPDPTADRGRHRFTYALMPHIGDFREAGVIEAAEDLNAPLRAAFTDLPTGTAESLVEVDTPQVVVAAVKQAEDSGATIMRLYEAWGRACRAHITTTIPHGRIAACDLLEHERFETSLELDFRPFQVVTLKLEQA